MSKFKVINILDLMEVVGENKLKSNLLQFRCPLNQEIEYFIFNNAMEFTKKKMSRYATLNSESNSYLVSAFLIAQFSKNYAIDNGKSIDGNEMMGLTLEILHRVQREIGGGIGYHECEDKSELLDFYRNDNNRFTIFDERYSKEDNTKYIQLYAIV
jgi:hypothetical protein